MGRFDMPGGTLLTQDSIAPPKAMYRPFGPTAHLLIAKTLWQRDFAAAIRLDEKTTPQQLHVRRALLANLPIPQARLKIAAEIKRFEKSGPNPLLDSEWQNQSSPMTGSMLYDLEGNETGASGFITRNSTFGKTWNDPALLLALKGIKKAIPKSRPIKSKKLPRRGRIYGPLPGEPSKYGPRELWFEASL